MKKYFLDTNVILRFLLKDNEVYFNQAKKYFEKAKKEEIELNLVPEVLFEIDYVLRGVYFLSKNEVADILLNLIKTPYIKIFNREMFITVVEKYKSINVDLFDIYLFYFSFSKNSSVLSFDKDFNKIKKLINL